MAATPPPSVTPVPTTVPVRGDRSTFSARLDAFITWLATGVTQLVALVANCYANAQDAYESAVAAAAAALSADGYKSAAQASAATATTAKNDALAAKVAVETIYDQFDDRYLGPKATDPTVDNDGNPLVDGAFYINTGTGALRAYTIANGWVQGIGAIAGVSSVSVNGGMAQTGAVNLLIENPNTLGGSVVSGSVVLTAASTSVQAINTTAPGQSVTFPNATTLREGGAAFTIQNTGPFDLLQRDFAGALIGFIRPYSTSIAALADNTTAAGVWSFTGSARTGVTASLSGTASGVGSGQQNPVPIQSVALDATRTMILFGYNSFYAVIFDSSTGLFGAPTLIATGVITNLGSGLPAWRAILHSSNLVFVAYCTNTPAVVGRTLSVTGTAITPNAVASQTTNPITEIFNSRNGRPLLCNGSYVVSGQAASGQRAVSFTVSGTTTSVGATLSLSTLTLGYYPFGVVANGTQVLFLAPASATTYSAVPVGVAGTVLTGGTAATITVSSDVGSDIRGLFVSAGRALFVFSSGSSDASTASLVSVTGGGGGVATASNVALAGAIGAGAFQRLGAETLALSATKFLLVGAGGTSTSVPVQLLTDTAGTASLGTVLSIGGQLIYVDVISPSSARVYWYTQYGIYSSLIDTSGTSPTLVSTRSVNALLTQGVLRDAVPFTSEPDGAVSGATLALGNVRAGVVGAFGHAVFRTLLLDGGVFRASEPLNSARTTIIGRQHALTTSAARGLAPHQSWVLSSDDAFALSFSLSQVELSA